ncbi:hypothetical protein MCP1_820004 [Candidatus Terasakiella magnetica]|nr:hypothetical protein MCP1_820004 [Candidatus Terasakiella magnetica]
MHCKSPSILRLFPANPFDFFIHFS